MSYRRYGILGLTLSLTIAAAGCADGSRADDGAEGAAALPDVAEPDNLGESQDAYRDFGWSWGYASNPGYDGWGWVWIPAPSSYNGGDWAWAWVGQPGWGWVYGTWRNSFFRGGYRGGYAQPPGLGFSVPLPTFAPPAGPPFNPGRGGWGSYRPHGEPPHGLPPRPGGHGGFPGDHGGHGGPSGFPGGPGGSFPGDGHHHGDR